MSEKRTRQYHPFVEEGGMGTANEVNYMLVSFMCKLKKAKHAQNPRSILLSLRFTQPRTPARRLESSETA